MKRMYLYMLAISLSFCLGFLVIWMKPQRQHMILTVDTEYSFVMEDHHVGSLLFYVSDENHLLTDGKNYMRLILSDETNDQQIDLNIDHVDKGHEEYYLKDRYVRVIILFDLPVMNHDIFFEDACLTIELVDQKAYEWRLGRVSFYQPSTDEKPLDWTVLEGIKKENDLRSRLHTIMVSYQGDFCEIASIDVGTEAKITFEKVEGKLMINIASAPYLLYDVPIVITYVSGERQIIPNLRYITDYVILKESGPLINVYTLD